ncbi:two-component sensor histidine kinase [Pseudomonas daroniae]|uniref:histidine kinase n=1 Tax=Phytopseudomonas daroniae TaxID=2487519 RepID=A0A4Q9QQQ6_9GAMM|nr:MULTISPECIES: ATP-binding protein [Pseudomonas]TBU78407.1 two-component sensor histidine kinase [Pseudomonas daroniae]TBU82915.1 two-component sensor histidine kinase [Pseudomonas daroniae]TBU85885.1 two-component sensor histidine kinase [Pseudomonas sp. FRB 228]TBU95048.1 two-component sensor histidine kinase [Pseudomonas daroniae]
MISIRTRILAPTIALVLAGSLALVLLALRDSHRQTEAVYDAQLVQAARLLQGLLQQPDGQQIDWSFVRQALDGAMDRSAEGIFSHPYEINLAFQVWAEDGTLLVRSEEAPPLASPPAPGIHEFFLDDQEWCGVLLEDAGQGLRIWVGEREDLRQDLIQQILQHTLMPTLVCLPLLAAFIWLLLGWGLRPLQRLAQQLRERPEHSLAPLPAGPLPPELEPMRLALDDVLSQLRALLERERRFIADAAHELRTPLAILDIHVRNALQAGSVQERDEALSFLQQGVHRATRIASQLLTMARLETPSQSLQPLDLTTVVREELADLAPLALNRRIDLALEADEAVVIQGDRGLIVILLQNLVSNALTFSSPGSEVSVRVCREDEGVRLQVVDQGPGIEEARLPRLGERFHSAGNPQGAGLGLAIVGMIARHLGGSIGFSNASPKGFRAVVSFPYSAL